MKKIILITSLIISSILVCNGQKKETFTLKKVLEIANENSPTLIQTRLSLIQSEENLKAQNADMKSQFSLKLDPFSYSNRTSFDKRTSTWFTNKTMGSNGTFTISQPIVFTDGVISLNNRFGWQKSETVGRLEDETFSNKLYLSIEQPIFTYNRRKMRLKELEFDYENSKMSYILKKLNIEKTVTQQFYQVYKDQKDLTIAKEEFRNQEKNYNMIKAKVEAGLLKKEELFQAEVNFATSKSNLYNKEIALENSKDGFRQSLGIGLDRDFLILANVKTDKIDLDMQDAVQKGLNQRMELRQKEIATEQALFNLIKTKASNEFKGSISASFGLLGQNSDVNKMFHKPTDDQAVTVSLNIPVWDWGAKRARVRASKAAIESSRIDTKELKKSIEIDIRKTCRNIPNLLKQIEIAKQNVSNAERTYDLNLEKYKLGNLTGMQLQQFQDQLTQKKQSVTSAIISYKLELLNLKIQTLWDYKTNKSYLKSNSIK